MGQSEEVRRYVGDRISRAQKLLNGRNQDKVREEKIPKRRFGDTLELHIASKGLGLSILRYNSASHEPFTLIFCHHS